MNYNIRGEKIVVTEAIKKYIINKLKKLDRYLKDSKNINARVLIKIRGYEQIVEVTIPIKQIALRAEEKNSDLYAAVDLVVEKLEKQLIKNKTRLASRFSKEEVVDFSFVDDSDTEEEETIIKRKKIEMKPMKEEDAILEMNLIGHDFFVFKDRDTEGVSVLYKRKDGNYGIIET